MAEQNLEEAVKVKAQLLDLAKRAKQRLDQRQKLEPLLGKTRTAIELMQAKVSEDVESRLNLAKEIHNQHDKLVDRIVDLKTKTSEEKERINPYQEVIDTLKTQLEQVQEDLSGHLLKISKLDIGIKEYEYIRRSYHDRNKIKMFILSDLVPYLNQRIEYYLNAFECDLKLTFTSTLSVETSRWGYDFHSGGQQKRIDLAIMFALYDLYISMYGQQCNVMVLDEVDGSLDPHGVRMFVDIIHNDFSGDRPDKPDTILIISHKNEMVDQFPNHVLVSMDPTGYSRIEKS
jgi:DNA repair exonuclease SbcCD ATPase subunit